MQRKLAVGFICLTLLVSVFSCNTKTPAEKDAALIHESEASLYADSLKPVDLNKAKEMIVLYKKYAENYPADSLAPEFLYKAGEIAMNLNLSSDAILIFQGIMTEYGNFDKVPYCLFLQAFIFENQLQDYDRAKTLYEEFLRQNPKHELAKDAEMSIRHMGKSLEEIIKEFEKDQ